MMTTVWHIRIGPLHHSNVTVDAEEGAVERRLEMMTAVWHIRIGPLHHSEVTAAMPRAGERVDEPVAQLAHGRWGGSTRYFLVVKRGKPYAPRHH